MKELRIDIGRYLKELEDTADPVNDILAKATYLAEEISRQLREIEDLEYKAGQVPILECKAGIGGRAINLWLKCWIESLKILLLDY